MDTGLGTLGPVLLSVGQALPDLFLNVRFSLRPDFTGPFCVFRILSTSSVSASAFPSEGISQARIWIYTRATHVHSLSCWSVRLVWTVL